MEFVTSLADLQGECSCPICLDDLKDPVTINCGHSFCFHCLSMSWKDLNDAIPCPGLETYIGAVVREFEKTFSLKVTSRTQQIQQS
uniref:RING-type domain-containing protein n=1 Tax=Spermophilus dauricus TaxID=99837 RepID=A0A8C9P8L2_SPEDA